MLEMKPLSHILGIDDKKGFDLTRNASDKEYVVSDIYIIGKHEVARIRSETSCPDMAEHWWGCRRCEERVKNRDEFKEMDCHDCDCKFCTV